MSAKFEQNINTNMRRELTHFTCWNLECDGDLNISAGPNDSSSFQF